MSYYSLDHDKISCTEQDGLTRVGRYCDDHGDITMHIIELVDGKIKTTILSDWTGPVPSDPTQADIALALTEIETHRLNRHASNVIRRQQAMKLAKSAVGLKLEDITLNQLKGMLSILFSDLGIIDEYMVVNPVEEWGKK